MRGASWARRSRRRTNKSPGSRRLQANLWTGAALTVAVQFSSEPPTCRRFPTYALSDSAVIVYPF